MSDPWDEDGDVIFGALAGVAIVCTVVALILVEILMMSGEEAPAVDAIWTVTILLGAVSVFSLRLVIDVIREHH